MDSLLFSFANFWGGGMVLLFGLVLRFVKGTETMISGFSTMSKAELAKWDRNKIRLFSGNFLIISSLILLIAGVLSTLGIYPNFLIPISWGLFVVIIISCAIYMNISPKFKIGAKQ